MLDKVTERLEEHVESAEKILEEEGKYERNTYIRGLKAGIEKCIREVEMIKIEASLK